MAEKNIASKRQFSTPVSLSAMSRTTLPEQAFNASHQQQLDIENQLTAMNRALFTPTKTAEFITQLNAPADSLEKPAENVEPNEMFALQRQEKKQEQPIARTQKKTIAPPADKDTLTLNEVHKDYDRAMRSDKRVKKSPTPIGITVTAGKKQIHLKFDSQKQLNQFINLLEKNKRPVIVTNDKTKKELYNPQKAKKHHKDSTQDFTDKVRIFDGSESLKIQGAELRVREFDALFEGPAEHKGNLHLEPMALQSEGPQAGLSAQAQSREPEEPSLEQQLEKGLAQYQQEKLQAEKTNATAPEPEPKSDKKLRL